MDGSFHPWLEERGPEAADDATNTTWGQLGEQETIWAVADALRAWIEQYGVPLALRNDPFLCFVSPCSFFCFRGFF
jgi:hypothetical protein